MHFSLVFLEDYSVRELFGSKAKFVNKAAKPAFGRGCSVFVCGLPSSLNSRMKRGPFD